MAKIAICIYIDITYPQTFGEEVYSPETAQAEIEQIIASGCTARGFSYVCFSGAVRPQIVDIFYELTEDA